MLIFLSPVLLLRIFLGMLRIVPLNYYGNILRCCHMMLALQTVSNNEELCLNIFFLYAWAACWGQEGRREPDLRARVASLWLIFILFIVIGSDGGPREKEHTSYLQLTRQSFRCFCISQHKFILSRIFHVKLILALSNVGELLIKTEFQIFLM